MQEQETKQNNQSFRAFSNSKAEVWNEKNANGYDIWYFDALSDNGKDAVRICFMTNDLLASSKRSSLRAVDKISGKNELTPSVSFSFFKEGKIRYFASAACDPCDFLADTQSSNCNFGTSQFVYGAAEYGAGHSVMLNLPISRHRSIEAHFEWLSVETDLGEEILEDGNAANSWNVVASRSDVTGRISVIDKNLKPLEVFHFRGSGYHDHRCGIKPFSESINDWEWGRVHYADATATFCRYIPNGSADAVSQMLIVKDDRVRWLETSAHAGRIKRGRYGVAYPETVVLTADENITLEVRPLYLIASGYNYLAFLSETSLTLRDGIQRKAIGITEKIVSQKIRRGWINRLLNFRIISK